MALTPEERQRIYEEEKVRLEVQAQLRDEEKQRTRAQAHQTAEETLKPVSNCCIGSIVVFTILMMLGILLGGPYPAGVNEPTSPSSGSGLGPHDGKTQEQVDQDVRDIRTLREAAERLKNDPQFRNEADRAARRSIREGNE